MSLKPDLFDMFISELPGNVKKYFQKIAEENNIVSAQINGEIQKELNIDIENLMVMLLPFAAEFAKVPVSQFKVGASVLCNSGNIYLGSNMEFKGGSLNCSIHAEQSAINNAWLNGETGISKIAVTSAPCGHCRQFLNELINSEEVIIILTNQKTRMIESYNLAQFLPNSFGPADLNINDYMMKDEDHQLSIVYSEDELIDKALKAANKSYAPYSKNYSGVSVKLKNGIVYNGRYAENAAYNPSLSPLQSALAFINMNLLIGAENEIEEVVLVESSSIISQKRFTETLLSSLGDIKFRYFCIKN